GWVQRALRATHRPGPAAALAKAAARPVRAAPSGPLDAFWISNVLPLLEAIPSLRPITILEELDRRHPDRDWMRHRRTLERRIRCWRALHGPERGIVLRQRHPPGDRALSDLTHASDLRVTIAGTSLDPRLYHFAPAYP